jgi:hypothetical protein
MPAPDVAREHQRSDARVATIASAAVRRLWQTVDYGDLANTWARVENQASSIVAAAQLSAVRTAESYVEAALVAQGLDPASVASIVPRSFAGVSSTGGPLPGLLRRSVGVTQGAVATGAGRDFAMSAGEAFLHRAVTTQVADASRSAVGTTMVTRRTATGYVRMISVGACARCIALSGRFYKWNAGFARHPHCTCTHIPSSENLAGDSMTDPDAYFRSLSVEEQEKAFTKAGAQAIRDGADLGQVVNSRSGMYVSDEGFGMTRAGATKYRQRAMPETLYSQASTREEALALLRHHGYIR